MLLVQESCYPVEVGSLSHHTKGVSTIPSGFWGFLNHEQYIPGFSSYWQHCFGTMMDNLTGWSIQWLQPQHEHLPETGDSFLSELFFQVALSIKPTLHPGNLNSSPLKKMMVGRLLTTFLLGVGLVLTGYLKFPILVCFFLLPENQWG